MEKILNSSELAKQVSDALQLDQAQGLELYKALSQIPDGPVKDALYTLSRPKVSPQKYAACIKPCLIQDARYLRSANTNPVNEDNWASGYGKPLFLEIVEANSPTRAVQIAAARSSVAEDAVMVYLV